nr:hypothetical protein StreXyl84_65670 [Streptomyces sp. Xyl84]
MAVGVRGEDDDCDDPAADVHGQAARAAWHRSAGSSQSWRPGARAATWTLGGIQHHQGLVLRRAGAFRDLATQKFMEDLVGPSSGQAAKQGYAALFGGRSCGRQAHRQPVRPW